jgi:hypothetical protein
MASKSQPKPLREQTSGSDPHIVVVTEQSNFADRSLGPSSKGVADAPRERIGIVRWQVTFWTKSVTHRPSGRALRPFGYSHVGLDEVPLPCRRRRMTHRRRRPFDRF